MPPADQSKKERVIHARIPESLDDEVKKRATDLGLSVSNLVRNVLQHAFGLVEDVVHDSAAIARAARDARAAVTGGAPSPRRAEPAAAQVLGWQRAVLNVNALCDRCNAILAKGTQAALGVLDQPGTPPFRCLTCLKELEDEPHDV
ncbi:MAG: hypothetical protein SF182_20015 [Deltaproteobacteria bacterium]|nr:hypothetical protein [Deltaproteobacteria bacterium]